MDKIKRYIECYLPVTTCNFRCSYCYITQTGLFASRLPVLEYSIDHMLGSLTRERFGGTCLFNICGGGETMLPRELTDIVRGLLTEGHYVSIVTNGTVTKRFDEMLAFPEKLLERLFFKFSFQYTELIRAHKLDVFFDTIVRVKKSVASFVLEITPDDSLVEHIPEMIRLSELYLGAKPHITIARKDSDPSIPMLTNYSKDKFASVWSVFESEMLKYKLTVFGEKRKEFCYAGDWLINLDLISGDYRQCYAGPVLGNVYKNTEDKLSFRAIGHHCRLAHCFNGHAFLTLGVIPSLPAPDYAHIRNRRCSDGTEWLKSPLKDFFMTSLKESNEEYGNTRKRLTDFHYYRYKALKLKNKFLKALHDDT